MKNRFLVAFRVCEIV